MTKPTLIRITTVPMSLDKLIEGQMSYMKSHFEVLAISSLRKTFRRSWNQRGGSRYSS